MHRSEILLFLLIAGGIFAWIVYLRVRERRYLKKKTKEALSKRLRDEIERERGENIRKKEKFESMLKKFEGE